MGRVKIVDEQKYSVPNKTEEQILKEKNEINQIFSRRKSVNEEQSNGEALKVAMQENDTEAFKSLLAKKRGNRPADPVVENKVIEGQRHVSLNFGVIGVGQAGSRIAQVFYDLGYGACAINTAKQDLDLLEIPESLKFFIDYSLGGAGRQLEVGRAAIESAFDDVRNFISNTLASDDVMVLCTSGGGGSGAGAAPVMIEMLSTFGKPVIVIYVLPGSTDDSQSKHNAITTLAELTDMASKQKINSLVLVDNAKIELAYPNLSQAQFWQTANNAIVNPLHMFNYLTARPTSYEALDTMDFSLALLESGGCTLFGSNKVPEESYGANELALVEAIIDNLDKGLLAGGFDLKESQVVGILVTAKQSVLERIPHNQISFIFKYIAEEYASARTFKGVYEVDDGSDDITVHFVFSGLGLPRDRVESLKREASKHMDVLANKKKDIASKMTIDLGKDKSTTAADNLMNKIKRNKGAIGQLIKNHKAVERKR